MLQFILTYIIDSIIKAISMLVKPLKPFNLMAQPTTDSS